MTSSTDRRSSFRGARSVVHSLLRNNSNQVASLLENRDDDRHLSLFHSRVSDHLSSLSKLEPLSLSFIRNLLQSFLSCESEFRHLISVSSPPIATDNKPLLDLLDRLIKSLDILNDLTACIQSTQHWNRHADIAASALAASASLAQLRRAERALRKLLPVPEDSNSTTVSSRTTERAWSFLSRNNTTTNNNVGLPRTWTAGKQLSAMSANLSPPRVSHEGVGSAAHTMSLLVVFAMRALVAAFSGMGYVQAPVGVWGPAVAEMDEKVGEEWRRRRRIGGRGLKEVVEVERCGKGVMDAVVEEVVEVAAVVERAADLGEAGRRLAEGLGEMEREVRAVFHRIVMCREAVIRCVETADMTCISMH